MNFLHLAAVALTFVFADSEADKHHRKPCGGCGSKKEAEQVAIEYQLRFQGLTARCDYKSLLEMSTPDATFRTTDYFCPNGCCYDEGNMEQWWTYFTCQDQYWYPEETRKVEHKPDGTIVISTLEITAERNGGFFEYFQDYWWTPVEGKCEFKLTKITGNAINCPKVLPTNILCTDCPVVKK